MTKNPNDKKAEIVVSVDLLKKIGNVGYKFLSIILLVVVSFQLSSVYGVLDAIASMQYEAFGFGSGNNTQQTGDVVLTQTNWYKSHDLGVVTADKLFTLQGTNYLVVFRQDGCSYCVEAEKTISSWLNAGNDGNIYFVDMAKNPGFWGAEGAAELKNPTPTNIYIVGTPSFLYNNGGTFTLETGAANLSTFLNNIKK